MVRHTPVPFTSIPFLWVLQTTPNTRRLEAQGEGLWVLTATAVMWGNPSFLPWRPVHLGRTSTPPQDQQRGSVPAYRSGRLHHAIGRLLTVASRRWDCPSLAKGSATFWTPLSWGARRPWRLVFRIPSSMRPRRKWCKPDIAWRRRATELYWVMSRQCATGSKVHFCSVL